jgi:hypothetical protein
MKIEISEVFVTRTDSMTLDYEPSAVGIAALVCRPATIKQRNRTRAPLYVALSRFVPLCTAKMKKMLKLRPQISMSPPDISVPSTS